MDSKFHQINKKSNLITLKTLIELEPPISRIFLFITKIQKIFLTLMLMIQVLYPQLTTSLLTKRERSTNIVLEGNNISL